jgi:Ca2+-binding RTX toxin-like protein
MMLGFLNVVLIKQIEAQKILKPLCAPYAEDPQPARPRQLTAATNFEDRITGSDIKDTIKGLKGNDCLMGKGGNDIIEGGEGSDTLIGGIGSDEFEGGGGRDIFYCDRIHGDQDEVIDYVRNADSNIDCNIE